MKQEGAHHVVECAQHPFSLVILCGGIRARGAKQDIVTSKEGRSGVVDELGAVVRLKTLDRQAEMGMSISNKLNNMPVDLRFMPKRKSPTVMCEIINHHKIVLKT